jgi:ABC-type polysaccharide/polyol phosphate export permease
MVEHMKAIWKFRYFWTSLVKMDLMTRYRKSVLGIGWSMLHPLAMTAIFCLVFAQLMDQNWMTYAQATLAGMAVYGFLRDSTLQGTQSLIRHESYIRQCPLPFGLYSLRVMLSNAVHFLITLAVLVLMIAGFQVYEGDASKVLAGVWKILPMIPVAFVFAWAVATVTGFATVYFHDVSHILDIGAQLMFFLTPIIYGRQTLADRGMEWVADYNPAAAFIDCFRTPLMTGEPAFVHQYLLASGTAAVMGGLAVLTVAKLHKRVIFQM